MVPLSPGAFWRLNDQSQGYKNAKIVFAIILSEMVWYTASKEQIPADGIPDVPRTADLLVCQYC